MPIAPVLSGYLINTLVLRTDLSGNPIFRELLGRVREVALGAYAHQHLPFDKLLEEMQPDRDLSRTPLFQVMFVLQNAPGSAIQLPDLIVETQEIDNRTSLFDLTLSLFEQNDELVGNFDYNTDLFDQATIMRMNGQFETLLKAIVTQPDSLISELPLLNETEKHQIVHKWNETQIDYAKDVCIHQLFEAQVEKTPEAIAVIYEDQRLTYRELNNRANQLAHHLREQGIGPDAIVGICIERSLEMIIGLLGILKAGGAYLPLDPTYPQERLVFMLEDAQTPLLLTREGLQSVLSN